MSALRADLVFSYWIYAWFLLYAFQFIQYSPKFALCLGLIDNIIMLILMMIYGTKAKTIFLFIIINTFIKIIPLYYLKNQKIQMKDIYFTGGLFAVFIVWLHINKQNLIGNIKLVHDSLLQNKSQTPLMHTIDQITKNFKNIQII